MCLKPFWISISSRATLLQLPDKASAKSLTAFASIWSDYWNNLQILMQFGTVNFRSLAQCEPNLFLFVFSDVSRSLLRLLRLVDHLLDDWFGFWLDNRKAFRLDDDFFGFLCTWCYPFCFWRSCRERIWTRTSRVSFWFWWSCWFVFLLSKRSTNLNSTHHSKF